MQSRKHCIVVFKNVSKQFCRKVKIFCCSFLCWLKLGNSLLGSSARKIPDLETKEFPIWKRIKYVITRRVRRRKKGGTNFLRPTKVRTTFVRPAFVLQLFAQRDVLSDQNVCSTTKFVRQKRLSDKNVCSTKTFVRPKRLTSLYTKHYICTTTTLVRPINKTWHLSISNICLTATFV